MLKEFKAFLMQTNALALAVGVIIGGAVGKVVGSLASDILMPIITMAIPGGTWRDLKLPLAVNPDGTVGNAITYGQFMGSLVDFVIIAFVVFMITRSLLKPAPAPAAPPTRTCPECRELIPRDAKLCRACGLAC